MPHGPLTDAIDPAVIESLFALYRNGDYSTLAERAESLLSTYPDVLVLHSLHGAALLELGDYAGAIESYQAALHIKPDFEKLHNSLGIVQLR
ncbi:MAG: tetratricopeptide repeat protein, partial [Gammaproteobacteria bacterium]|nr:tetratricopeptide repeat protein [Gammaproteobacteria bacterium]